MAIKKTEKAKKETVEKKDKTSDKSERYFYAVGRRKSAIAQVRIYRKEKAQEGDWIINGKEMKKYFPMAALQNIFLDPFNIVGLKNKFKVSILVKGGGPSGQVGAARLGIARALVKFDKDLKKILKSAGFLTRDSRVVERKKPGLKKARRAPQWQKR